MHASNEQILKLKLAARCAVSGCWPSCLHLSKQKRNWFRL